MLRALIPLIVCPVIAMAQVSVNPGALDSLKPTPPAATTGKPNAAKPAPHRHTAAGKPSRAKPGPPKPAPATTKPASAKPPPRSNAPVRVAPAPPPAPVIPPPVVVAPTKPVPPPPPPVAVPDAAGDATPMPGGVRISFGAGKADLNTATEAAIRTLARTLAANPSADLNVYAYAAGNADDPSTPRRLSLSRALAVRAVLMSEGIDSTRIYVRALGPTPSDGPADRVDLTRNGTP